MSDAKQEAELDALFADLRAETPVPDAALLARVLVDAETAQPEPQGLTPSAPAQRVSILAQLWQGLGGWPAMAGLSAATVAGVWIGISPPDFVDTQVASLLGVSALDETFTIGAGFDFSDFEG